MTILVTGASGHLGSAVVARLVADGHRVRAFQRRPRTDGLDCVVGNLGDAAAVARAVAGVERVIHCGAATSGAWPVHQRGTVEGTAHVLAACKAHGVAQLVHISSMSVIDWAGSAGSSIDERAALEPRPDERGAYTRAKLEAERLVSASGLPCVILRPGQIFGGGIALLNGAVARHAADRWLVLGDGSLELPLVYLDDVVDGVVAAIAKHLTGGQIIQLIDPTHLTQNEVLALAAPGARVTHLPRRLLFTLGSLSELPLRLLGRRSPIARYRLESALAPLHYASDRAAQLLAWHPRVGVREGIRRIAQGQSFQPAP